LLKKQLKLDCHISWRQSDKTLTLEWDDGDPAVVTISPNGYDAESMYLSPDQSKLEILKGTWYTIETLGRTSAISFSPDDFVEELAEKNWRPSPRKTIN
tara:strand:+ start:611 stop:907 length:297 start_codon:yes stop_codon:yes gene_type:complete